MQRNIEEFLGKKHEIYSSRHEESKKDRHVMLPMAYEKYWKDLKKMLYNVAFSGHIQTKVDFLALIQWCVVRNYIEKSTERVDLRCLNGVMSQLGTEGMSAFLYDLLPFISLSALQIDVLFDKKPTLAPLVTQIPSVLELTRGQITSLLAHCFLCSLPTQKEVKIFHFEDLYSLYSGGYSQLYANKILFLMNYFAAVKATDDSGQVNKVVKYTRIVLPQSEYDKLTLDYWVNSKKVLTPMLIQTSGGIEDCPNAVMVDFANKYLGGGVLEHGAVQEEILFLLMPELLVTRFMCDRLADNEALLVEGLGMFGKHSGYSRDLRFEGPYTGTEKYNRSIIAIDALPFANGRDQLMQFHKKPVLRELNKAFIGFNIKKYQDKANKGKKIATGRWGCGAFRGSAQLKMIIQWLAAAESGKELVFYCYEDPMLDKAADVIKKFSGKTVGELFVQLINFDNYFYDTLLKDRKGANVASDVDSFDTLLFNFLLSSP